MNKLKAIQHHQLLVAQRKKFIFQSQGDTENEFFKNNLKEIDKEIGRYGNVHNPKIATKAAQYIGL